MNAAMRVQVEALLRGEHSFDSFVRATSTWWTWRARWLLDSFPFPSWVTAEDLRQALLVGLWEALSCYDPGKTALEKAPTWIIWYAIDRAKKYGNKLRKARDVSSPGKFVLEETLWEESAGDRTLNRLTMLSGSNYQDDSTLVYRSIARSESKRRGTVEPLFAQAALEIAEYDVDLATSVVMADRTVAKTRTMARRVVVDHARALVAQN